MIINGHIIDDELKKFLASAPVCRLVAVDCQRGCECDTTVLDLGFELANAIVGFDRSSAYYSMRVEDALNTLVGRFTFQAEDLGAVLVLKNPGIMFESALNLNVISFLRRISRNTLVVLLWPGEMSIDRLSFLSSESDFSILQSDINYTMI